MQVKTGVDIEGSPTINQVCLCSITLEQVASLARQWFERYLISAAAHPGSANFAKRNV